MPMCVCTGGRVYVLCAAVPGAASEVTGWCGPPDTGAGNPTQVFWKSDMCPWLLNHHTNSLM